MSVELTGFQVRVNFLSVRLRRRFAAYALVTNGSSYSEAAGVSSLGGGVALTTNTSSTTLVTTATSLGPNCASAEAVDNKGLGPRARLMASFSCSCSLCSRSRVLSSLAAISAPVNALASAFQWIFLGNHFRFGIARGLEIGIPRPS